MSVISTESLSNNVMYLSIIDLKVNVPFILDAFIINLHFSASVDSINSLSF